MPKKKTTKELKEFAEELRLEWNKIPGVHKSLGFNTKLLSMLRARLDEPNLDWAELCQEALQKMRTLPKGFFGANPRHWRPNLEWLLRPQSVLRVCEGFYNGWKAEEQPPDILSIDPYKPQ